jgi:acetyltransferase-like isoleucine patch superfamily enzyme
MVKAWIKQILHKNKSSINEQEDLGYLQINLPIFSGNLTCAPEYLVNRFKKYSVANNLVERLDSHILCNDHPMLPNWWVKSNNQLYLPAEFKNANIPSIVVHPGQPQPTNFCLILNGKSNYVFMLWGKDGLVYISEKSNLNGANISIGGGHVFVGDDVKVTSRLKINCRNGGGVSLHRDILIASDVSLMSDDCHTVMSRKDNKRINPYGGQIEIKDHVWIANKVTIMGDSYIEKDSIVGLGSYVRGVTKQAGVILAGVPAKIIKTDITWDIRDLPPDTFESTGTSEASNI